MYIIIPDKLYSFLEKYATKYNLKIEDVVVSAIISYITQDPEIALDILEGRFEFRRYLTKREKELLINILKIPKEERNSEKIKEMIGEENFHLLIRKGLLKLREYEGRRIYEIPHYIYKQLEPEIKEIKEKEEPKEEIIKKEVVKERREIGYESRREGKKFEFILFRKENEKLITAPETFVPEKALLCLEDVRKAIEVIRNEFPEEFSLENVIELLSKKFKGVDKIEIELIARAAIAQLYMNGEIYNPHDLVFAWV